MPKFIAVLLLVTCGAALGANDPDAAFGPDGVRAYGFDAVGGSRNDRAAVACPGPRGSLFAVGTASADRRVVSVWLAENGVLDASFSDDGKQSFDLPAAYAASGETGLCGSDGRVTVAFESIATNDEGHVTLLRIDPSTGLPDPAFGAGGRVDIDLDRYGAGLGTIESPTAVGPGRDGDVVVTGWYDRPGDPSSGFVIRVTAGGVVAAVALADAFDAANHQLVAAMPSPDGGLWVAGSTHGSPRTGRLFRLDYASLAYEATPIATLPGGVEPRSGRALDASTFALAGRIDEATPAVALATASGATATLLPAVPGARLVVGAQIVPLANGTFVVAADIVDPTIVRYGHYFAGLRRAGNAFALEPTFGDDGVRLVPPPTAGGCARAEFDFARLTVWRDRPLWFGTTRVCEPGGEQHGDYQFLRLTRSDLIFRGGFQ